MANVNYAYTSLSAADSLALVIGDNPEVTITRVSAAFAINQVPEAMCGISLGRNAYDGITPAAIHKFFNSLTSMTPAKVYATLQGNYKAGLPWPKQKLVIFDGYFVGFSYQKANGNVQLVVHLLHWLADLGFTSCLSGATSPSMASSLVDAAIFQMSSTTNDAGSAGGGEQAAFLPSQSGVNALADQLPDDTWGAMKNYLSTMSTFKGFQLPSTFNPDISSGCSNPTQVTLLGVNNRAARALARIEGPAADNAAEAGVVNIGYTYASPLDFNKMLTTDTKADMVAQTIGHKMVSSQISQTFWDILVQEYCPEFSIDICPGVERAIVMPSCTGWRGLTAVPRSPPSPPAGAYWRTITPDEYDCIDETGMLPKPLRGVVIHGVPAGQAYGNSGASGAAITSFPLGAYAIQSQDTGDGAILYQPPPLWLNQLPNSGSVGVAAADSNGTKAQTPVNSATNQVTSPAPPDPSQVKNYADTNAAMCCYARVLFIQNMLRGRSANLSGRLRFDIAPGSHVAIAGSPEQFIGSQDNLGGNRYGQVIRVTYEIDAESRRACTAFQIASIRNQAENQSDRTSIADHPFFANSMGSGGMPLIPEMDLPSPPSTGDANGTA